MKKITLKNYLLQQKTQEHAASIMGVTQGAVSQMMKKGKTVYLVFSDSGDLDYWYPFEPREPGRQSVSR